MSMFNKLDIVVRIEALLKEKKISAVRFAEAMGGKDNSYNKDIVLSWRKNKSTSYINDMQKIADYLNVSTDYLLTGKVFENTQELTMISVNRILNLPNHDELANNIEEVLKQLNKPKTKTLEESGVGKSFISNIRSGKQFPGIDKFVMLANHLNIPIDRLLGREAKPLIINEELEGILDTKNTSLKGGGILINVNRIMELIAESGNSKNDIEKKCSLSNGVIGKWEKGLQKPSTEAIIEISKFFNVSTDYLLGRSDMKNFEHVQEPTLTVEEQELLEGFRKLDFRGQSAIGQALYKELDRVQHVQGGTEVSGA